MSSARIFLECEGSESVREFQLATVTFFLQDLSVCELCHVLSEVRQKLPEWRVFILDRGVAKAETEEEHLYLEICTHLANRQKEKKVIP